MTTITIVAPGSRGDVQPYVALGQALQHAGYDVRLAASAGFEALVTEAGLPFYSMGLGAEERLQRDEWRKTLEGGNFFNIFMRMRAEMRQAANEFARLMPPLLDGSNLIIAGVGSLSGVQSIAERFHIPLIHAHVFPFTPTRAFATPLVLSLPFGNTFNRLSFHLTQQMFWHMSRTGDVATRQLLGMAKPPIWGPFGSPAYRHSLTLYGFSRYVIPRPQDWEDHIHVTGYWFLDESDGWQPPVELVDFLNAGDPPVYIGFGSMTTRNPEEAGRIALEALERSGQRGVIASGWGGLRAAVVPRTVHMISALPHSWLFPRMGAVVHHGGAGTTAAGLRAGVPSIIVPFALDQPFWGKRVADLGVGPQPIPRKKLTSERLAQAITEALSNHAMRQRASQLGQQIGAEGGTGAAVDLIKTYLLHQ